MDAILLARIQFGFTISFHIVFPAITIGLASYLAVLEALWLATGRSVYMTLYRFWLRPFAVAFAMGVVSGIVMAYQFGTHWSGFSCFAGAITGPLLTYEVLTAFFLEAGFLRVMLFGLKRVGPGLHFLSTCVVALGTLVSATWILASNSWMQTPQGHEIVNGVAVPVDWLRVIFNPSFPFRLSHMVTGAFLATALIVGGTGAWHLLRRPGNAPARSMLSMAMWMLLGTAPAQAVIGDLHGLNTLEHQPAKLAAMEGHWEPGAPGEGVPLILFGWPDMDAEMTRHAVEIPRLGSLILTHSWDAQIPALKDFPAADRPDSTSVFWTFRIMVGLGLLMIALAFWGAWLRRSARLYGHRRFLRCTVAMSPAGLAAILAGWYTTEAGRQPWVVYGLLRTSDAASSHPAGQVAFTLGLFVAVYLMVFGAGTAYGLHLLAEDPADSAPAPEGGAGQSSQAMRPLSAAQEGDGHGN
ncbi:cytochrome ubiquinol oxidase subunit I [Castellaniella daejeonensis]|uniref:Cytochrome ubiquinol oxidase subunit I n=1 Tax=Castellaniella daejeonensis TaxID=659013 RepID=A0ABP3D4B2_9BURK